MRIKILQINNGCSANFLHCGYSSKKANFKNCKFIEQPCKIGILNSDLALFCPVNIYAQLQNIFPTV